jgi:excisionase family DNA binding protein
MKHPTTTTEAAKILAVTPVRIRQLIQHGALNSLKSGRDHLLERNEVIRFGKKLRKPGRPPKAKRKTLRVR